jgi:hypothetical protein
MAVRTPRFRKNHNVIVVYGLLCFDYVKIGRRTKNKALGTSTNCFGTMIGRAAAAAVLVMVLVRGDEEVRVERKVKTPILEIVRGFIAPQRAAIAQFIRQRLSQQWEQWSPHSALIT